jgi:hypothetical protein
LSTAEEVQALAKRAGVKLTAERAGALAPPLQAVEDAARMLAGVDYGETEPASRFRAPGANAK